MCNNNQFIGFSKPFTDGTAYFAPHSASVVLPTDAISPLDENFKNLGRLSEDGVTFAAANSEPENVYADGRIPVDSSDSEYNPSVTASLLQIVDIEVAKAVYGEDNVIGTQGNYRVRHNANNNSRGVFVIQRRVAKSSIARYVIPDGKLTVTGDIAHNASSLVELPITITPSVDANGDAYNEYTLDTSTITYDITVAAGANGTVAPYIIGNYKTAHYWGKKIKYWLSHYAGYRP